MIRDDLHHLSLDVEKLKAKADVGQGNYGFAGGQGTRDHTRSFGKEDEVSVFYVLTWTVWGWK